MLSRSREEDGSEEGLCAFVPLALSSSMYVDDEDAGSTCVSRSPTHPPTAAALGDCVVLCHTEQKQTKNTPGVSEWCEAGQTPMRLRHIVGSKSSLNVPLCGWNETIRKLCWCAMRDGTKDCSYEMAWPGWDAQGLMHGLHGTEYDLESSCNSFTRGLPVFAAMACSNSSGDMGGGGADRGGVRGILESTECDAGL